MSAIVVARSLDPHAKRGGRGERKHLQRHLRGTLGVPRAKPSAPAVSLRSDSVGEPDAGKRHALCSTSGKRKPAVGQGLTPRRARARRPNGAWSACILSHPDPRRGPRGRGGYRLKSDLIENGWTGRARSWSGRPARSGPRAIRPGRLRRRSGRTAPASGRRRRLEPLRSADRGRRFRARINTTGSGSTP